jgi:glucarate dehydratase
MRITNLESFTVGIPFRAPPLSAFGVSYPARVRTFIRLQTDVGLVGVGESGVSAVHYFNRDAVLTRFEKQIKPAVIGENPADTEWIRRKLFQNTDVTAVEIACWDIMAQAVGVPLYRLLGGHGFVEQVPVSGYCFFRAPGPDSTGAVTLDTMVQHCQQIQAQSGFKVLKLKLGAHEPMLEAVVVEAVRRAVGDTVELRIDPNGAWSLPTALRVIKRLEPVDLEYVEEPTRTAGPGDGTTATALLRRLRESTQTPIAADHCYRLDLLAQIIRDDCADVVLADLFGCGGLAATVRFSQTAGAFGLGVALHSGAELCVGQVAKLHVQAALPDTIRFAGDTILPEYVDGVLKQGRLMITDGHMTVPQAPGLGVDLDDAKLAQWELTAARHQEYDAFWDAIKRDIGVDYPSADLLMHHY